MAEQTGVIKWTGEVREIRIHDCMMCDGDGIIRRSSGRGRPKLDAPKLWQFCRRCKGRGWVSLNGMTHSRNGVSHTERRIIRSVRSRKCFIRWRDGESLKAIGESFDPPVSRERVRQLIAEFTPQWEISLVHQLHLARGRLKDFERTHRPGYRTECWICGTTFDADGSTSSEFPVCSRHSTGDSTRALGLQWQDICNVRNRRDIRRACSSQPVVEGTGMQYGKRWTTPGSRMHREVHEAVINNWPVVGLLDPQIIEQHRKLLKEEQSETPSPGRES